MVLGKMIPLLPYREYLNFLACPFICIRQVGHFDCIYQTITLMLTLLNVDIISI